MPYISTIIPYSGFLLVLSTGFEPVISTLKGWRLDHFVYESIIVRQLFEGAPYYSPVGCGTAELNRFNQLMRLTEIPTSHPQYILGSFSSCPGTNQPIGSSSKLDLTDTSISRILLWRNLLIKATYMQLPKQAPTNTWARALIIVSLATTSRGVSDSDGIHQNPFPRQLRPPE